MDGNRGRRLAVGAGWLWCLGLGLAVPWLLQAGESDAGSLTPPPPPAGFQQAFTQVFVIQTDVSPAYLNTLRRQVSDTEQRMLTLFKITGGFVKGNDSKSILDKRFSFVKGDTLSKWGYKPWIELRVYKKFEDYADEWFDESNRLDALVNNTPVRKETPAERAVRRLKEGIPGAYYIRIQDYDKKYVERRIRAFMGDKGPEETEASLLHEMGHLFLETFLMEFAGAPKKGQEAQQRGTPAWIGEGVAQIFEVNWATSRESKKKKAQYQALIYESVKCGESFPFGEFINITNAHNLAYVANNQLKSTINYAQAFSVMQYMVEVKWQAFLAFLENCRAENFKKGFANGRISELYSIQDKAFRDAFTVPIAQMEEYWKKHVIATSEKELKRAPENYYWCGEYCLLKRDFAAAAERFKLAIEGAPQKGEGFLGMGRLALMKNENPTAVENLLKATQLSPQNEDGFYYLGVAQTRVGKHKEAIASLEQAVKLYPLFHQAQAALGDAYYNAREYPKALKAYGVAFDLSKHQRYLLHMGMAAFFAKEYLEAVKNYSAFSNIFPTDPEGHFWYGQAAWRQGQKDYGIKKMEEALKLDPNNQLYRAALEMAKQDKPLTFDREAPVKEGTPPAGGAAKTKEPAGGAAEEE